MLENLLPNDVLRLKKAHPCGSFEWTVTRIGADIGLECNGCKRRVMLARRDLAKRLKVNLTLQAKEKSTSNGEDQDERDR